MGNWRRSSNDLKGEQIKKIGCCGKHKLDGHSFDQTNVVNMNPRHAILATAGKKLLNVSSDALTKAFWLPDPLRCWKQECK
jgi:hypothetical protein